MSSDFWCYVCGSDKCISRGLNGCDICGLNPNYTRCLRKLKQSKKQQQDESDFIKEKGMCSACLND